MSDIFGKTLVSLQSLVSGSSTNEGKNNSNWSRKFKNFVENFCLVNTNDEEIRFMEKTIKVLRQSFSNPSVRNEDLQVYLAEAVICEMFGYPVPFAHIHAIKLAENSNFSAKRMGYLAARFFFNSDQELLVLLINTLRKDLNSPNIIEINMAMVVIAELIQGEMSSVVLQSVEEKLNHSNPSVRKKAIYCIQCIARKSTPLVQHTVPQLMKMLSDTDPSVMIAAYHALFHFIKDDPSKFMHILPSVIKIQEQIIRNKFPIEYNYNDVPAPWFQILIVQIIRELGKNNPKSVPIIQPLLMEMLQQGEKKKDISFAIMHECISTIAVIDVSEDLIELTLSSITLLLRSQDVKLKYIGLENLTKMVIKVRNCFDSKHQPAILECLQHPDVSIQLKTLDLIYELCNKENVVVVTGKFLDFLQICHDPHQQHNSVNKILDLANKFYPSFLWYIGIVEKVLLMECAHPDRTQMKIILRNLKNVVKCSPSEELFHDIIQRHANRYSSCDATDSLTSSYIQLSTWIFQEFGHFCSKDLDDKILQSLCNVLAAYESEGDVLKIILPCILKYVLRISNISFHVKTCVAKLENHSNFIVRQYVQEIRQSIAAHSKLKEMNIYYDIFETKIVVDPFLSHQDKFVVASLQGDSVPYISRSLVVNQDLSVHDLYQGSQKTVSRELDLKSESMKSSKSMGSFFSSGSGPSISFSSKSKKNTIWTRDGLQTLTPASSLKSSPSEDIAPQLQTSDEDLKKNLFAGVTMT